MSSISMPLGVIEGANFIGNFRKSSNFNSGCSVSNLLLPSITELLRPLVPRVQQ